MENIKLREWCDGNLHLIVLPFNFKGQMPNFSLHMECLLNPSLNKVYTKKCNPNCTFFLKNGIDECGCYKERFTR